MNNGTKIKLTILLFILLSISFPHLLKAQQSSGVFIMSSVGSIQNMSNNSMSVNFSSDTACLHLQNGTAVFIGDRGAGSFSINCEVRTKFNTLGVKLYPNPVVDNSKVMFVNAPPLNDPFTVSIWSQEGFKISSVKSTGYELFQGKEIDFSALVAGSFILQIESVKYRDAIKFIKVQ